jgi:hypothetical protein
MHCMHSVAENVHGQHAHKRNMMQVIAAQSAAREGGATLEDAALERLAAEVEAGRASAQEWAPGMQETNDTMAFIDGLKAEERAQAEIKQVRLP